MLLAFDTTQDVCSVALLDGAGVPLGNIRRQMSRGHAEALIPMIEEALSDIGAKMVSIDRLAVTIGPGTFTGVRVGVSAARGLALALKVPVAGITTLEMLAGGAVFSGEVADGQEILATIDARRGQAYVAIHAFDSSDDNYPLLAVAAPQAVALEEIGGWLDQNSNGDREIVAVGNAAGALCDHDARLRASDIDVTPDAAIVAGLAARLPAERWKEKPHALYLRAPDATLPASAR